MKIFTCLTVHDLSTGVQRTYIVTPATETTLQVDIYLFDCTRPEYRCSTYLHRYTGHRNNATGSVCEC